MPKRQMHSREKKWKGTTRNQQRSRKRKRRQRHPLLSQIQTQPPQRPSPNQSSSSSRHVKFRPLLCNCVILQPQSHLSSITLCVLYGFQTTRCNPVKTDEFYVLELRMIPWGLIRVGGASLWTTKATFRAGFGCGKKL